MSDSLKLKTVCSFRFRCLLDGPERSEDLEEWVITPGRPPLIKPYAMVDLRTLQLQMRRENESNGQLNRSNGRANNRCNSLHNPYKEDGSSGDINHVRKRISISEIMLVDNKSLQVLGNGEGRHYESIFDSVEKRRSCLPDIVAAHTAEVSYQNLPI